MRSTCCACTAHRASVGASVIMAGSCGATAGCFDIPYVLGIALRLWTSRWFLPSRQRVAVLQCRSAHGAWYFIARGAPLVHCVRSRVAFASMALRASYWQYNHRSTPGAIVVILQVTCGWHLPSRPCEGASSQGALIVIVLSLQRGALWRVCSRGALHPLRSVLTNRRVRHGW